MSHTATTSFQHTHLSAEAEPGIIDCNLSLSLDGYEIRDSAEVENYLNHNNDLIDFLASLPAHISEKDNDISVCLEHYRDRKSTTIRQKNSCRTAIKILRELEK